MTDLVNQSPNLERLIDSLIQPVLVFEGLELVSSNQAAREMLALSEGQLCALTADKIVSPCPQINELEETTSFSGRLLTSSGTGTMVRGRITDLGQGKYAWTLERVGALADLGALTAGWIHNLAGPLSVIRSTAELMDHIFRRQAGNNPNFADWFQSLPETARQGLDTIIEAVDQCSQSAGELMARIQGEAIQSEQELDLNRILTSELEFMRGDSQFKYEIDLSTELDPNLPPVRGIYSDFSQSLRHILLNAVEAMAETEEKRLRVRTSTGPEGILISIADTGPGINEEIKQTIFEPFITSKDLSRGASGLGLHTARQLLKPYRAVFEVESNSNGSVFSITLPK